MLTPIMRAPEPGKNRTRKAEENTSQLAKRSPNGRNVWGQKLGTN